jgi:Tfp pilus assembly protein PilF
MVDRFTQTYLDRWQLTSLKQEYAFVQGSRQCEFSTEVMSERIVGREEVATALADRAMVSVDVIDPAIMQSFIEQAFALLRDGQRTAAAALFNSARMLKPKDSDAKNNYAFCVLIDKPYEAKGLLTEVLESPGRTDSSVTWCNLALAEFLVGNLDAALMACEQAYEDGSRFESILWVRRGREWEVEFVMPRVWATHFGAELERSKESSEDVWLQRLASLTALESRATSSDPSSTGTSEADL